MNFLLLKSLPVQVRNHRMLLSRNQNQRCKGIKINLGLKAWLTLTFCVWMIYQLRVFLNHNKQSSQNGLSVKEEDQSGKLKLGRKGLILIDSEIRKYSEEGEAMEEDKGRKKPQLLEDKEEMEEQNEDLVEGMDKGGDGDDEELDTVRFDDPMDEIDSLNDDDDDDGDDDDDNATTDQHGEEEDDSPLQRQERVGTKFQ
ncbi:hypothetical protein V2J09_017090 [Rumex salicifolius]